MIGFLLKIWYDTPQITKMQSMAILQLKNAHIAFGVKPILDGVNFGLEVGERVCLLGRNGEGKSTFLKAIMGEVVLDDGELVMTDGTKIAMLAQEVPSDDKSVLEVVMDGNPRLAKLLSDYHQSDDVAKMADLQEQIEQQDGWDLERKALALVDGMGLSATARLADLSGGKKRRAMLARALVCDPDVLLLDEPTNHLDIDSIDWLENFLLSQRLTVLFITHDRKFVDKLATRIVELDRGKLSSYDVSQGTGGFARYQELKEQELLSEEKSFHEFDKRLAQEEAWIRQGIKARRTRNEGRVRALKAMREERKARRERVGSISLSQQHFEKGGKIVCEAQHITLRHNVHTLVKDFSTTVMRGDKIGIIGKNGVGKTTLIKTLLGLDKSALVQGHVLLGAAVEVAFFDQLKDQLDPELSIAHNVAQGSDYVEIGGSKKHIVGYLQDFLFSPERIRTPIKALSGGERARVLLAKQLLKPANVLVLDEPTNDLDMSSLELLEEFVANFDGTVLLISHDRAFMDNVVTQTWVFGENAEGDGVIYEYVGGYEDYLVQHEHFLGSQKTQNKAAAKPALEPKTQKNTSPSTKRKLSYKENQELLSLPDEICALEEEQALLHQKLADGSWFVSDLAQATQASERVAQIDDLLLEKMERLEELQGV